MLYRNLLLATWASLHFRLFSHCEGTKSASAVMMRTQLRRRPRKCLTFGFVDILPQRQFTARESCIKFRYGNISRCLSNRNDVDSQSVSNIAIVGGGLAGLSAAYHLLDIVGNKKTDDAPKGLHITIYDKTNVGEGGASAVAGGLIHPFSPRGKLIHFGLSALESSNHLIQMAAKHEPQCIVRPHLYRIALADKNVAQLQHTAENYPDMAEWMSKEEMHDKFGLEDSLGGLKLGNGCKVIHTPSYLRGLWAECEMKAEETNGSIKWEVMQMPARKQEQSGKSSSDSLDNIGSFNNKISEYDAVILAAGSGIIDDQLISTEDNLPVSLVRGQSVEMSLPKTADGSDDDINASHDAFLCGKYISPLPSCTSENDVSSQRFVIGATHEYNNDALTLTETIAELKSRSYSLAPKIWDHGSVDRLTTGVRLQSHRGSLGRMPIIGRYDNTSTSKTAISHQNLWLFTGLSSRGLIYHGIFGRWLANAVLQGNEESLHDEFAEFGWWRKKLTIST